MLFLQIGFQGGMSKRIRQVALLQVTMLIIHNENTTCITTALRYADNPGIRVLDLYKHTPACKRNRAVPVIVGRFKALQPVQLGSLLDPLIKHASQSCTRENS